MVRQLIGAGLACLLLGGCVIVPLPVAVPPEEKPFTEHVDETIVVGKTTREDLLELLGDPLFDDNDRLVFKRPRDGWSFAACGFLLWNGGCDFSERTQKDFFLVADFGAGGLLKSADIGSARQVCDDLRFCTRENLLVVPDDRHPGPEAGCRAHVYLDGGDSFGAAVLSVNGARFGSLVSPNAYQSIALEAGTRVLTVSSGQWGSAAHRFDCREQEDVYLRVDLRMIRDSVIFVDNQEAGLAELERRWRARRYGGVVDDVQTRWLADIGSFVSQGDSTFKIVQPGASGEPSAVAVSDSGEPCGVVAAMSRFELAPRLMWNGIFLADSKGPVEFLAVCSENGGCEFPSTFGDEPCSVPANTSIEYFRDGRLLVVEPDGDSVRPIFYGKKKLLRKHSSCTNQGCATRLATLRSLELPVEGPAN